ncbi:MAG: peptidylprolyl isomerase [Deferribacteres bacterium]|nr:peptidylprolyl isomerase [candidate division KSB1 bacterium]MCB9509462.1 peptidylprolyl isomerase [Deferribacteres bacterium]
MALMDRMRGLTKIILYGLVFAFVGTIIFDWGMDFTGLKQKTGLIAEVNGEEIPVNRFSRLYNAALDNYQQRTGTSLTEVQQDYIMNQVWEDLVRNTLERQVIDQKGLTATNSEILHYMVEDPPDFIKNLDSSFVTPTGQLNRAVYNEALRNPQNDPIWKNIENYMRENLPFQKLRDMVAANVFVTESEIHQEFVTRNQKASVEYLFFDPARFNSVDITINDADVKKLYKEKKDDFKQAERRKIDYVIYSTRPTQKDTAAIMSRAQELIERAKSGDDFGDLAATFSEDEGSAENNGDLGFQKRGTWVKPFEDAAFGAEVGDIVGPVQSNFGLHIIKVNGKKTEDKEELVSASHILLKFRATDQTKSAALDSADYLATLARDGGWQQAVESEKVRGLTSAPFQEGSGFIPGLGIESRVSRFVFRNPVGTISDPIETENAYVVVRVAEIDEERTKTLDEVRSTLESELRLKQRKSLAGELARKVREEITNGTSIEAIAARDSLTLQKPAAFARNNSVPSVGRDPEFIGTAFSLTTGSLSKPVEGFRGYYLIRLLEKTPIQEQDYLAQKAELRAEIKTQKEQAAFSQWYAQLRENAEIKDYRKQYF